jgi:hypothetical protein
MGLVNEKEGEMHVFAENVGDCFEYPIRDEENDRSLRSDRE